MHAPFFSQDPSLIETFLHTSHAYVPASPTAPAWRSSTTLRTPGLYAHGSSTAHGAAPSCCNSVTQGRIVDVGCAMMEGDKVEGLTLVYEIGVKQLNQ